MPVQPLVILGASGNALDILDVVDAINASGPVWEVLGVLDDNRAVGSWFHGLKVLGAIHDTHRFPDAWFLSAVGSDRSHRSRGSVPGRTGLPLERFATLIHPSATVSPKARLGAGTCVNANVCIARAVMSGVHVWFGTASVIGHEAAIEDHAVIGPGSTVSGAVQLGDSCYVGARAVIRERLRVGEKALVGMGAVVTRDVPAYTTVIGNPARALDRTGASMLETATHTPLDIPVPTTR